MGLPFLTQFLGRGKTPGLRKMCGRRMGLLHPSVPCKSGVNPAVNERAASCTPLAVLLCIDPLHLGEEWRLSPARD